MGKYKITQGEFKQKDLPQTHKIIYESDSLDEAWKRWEDPEEGDELEYGYLLQEIDSKPMLLEAMQADTQNNLQSIREAVEEALEKPEEVREGQELHFKMTVQLLRTDLTESKFAYVLDSYA